MSGYSVYKAASNEGVSVSDISSCKVEACFLSHGMDIIDKHEDTSGKYTVTYRAVARKSGANYLRAPGHGTLDALTLGLWEVAGTPVEGAISNNRGYITVKAIYSSKGSNQADSLQIFNAYGKLVIDNKVNNN